MSTFRDPDRLIHSFLREGEEELFDQVYDRVRAGIEDQPQRVVIGPWRMPIMNRIAGFGLSAAAVVAVIFLGAQLIGTPSGGVGTGTPSSSAPSRSELPVLSAAPSTDPPQAVLSEGPLLIWDPASQPAPWDDGPPITISIPGDDFLHQWEYSPEYAAIGWTEGTDPPAGAGMIVYSTSSGLYVYGDPCRWESTRPETPATSADEFVTALASQASRSASVPRDITVGGYSGKFVTLRVPDDAPTREEAFAGCDQSMFATFEAVGDAGPARYHQGPGQIDELWILDVNGALVIIDAMYGPQTNLDLVDDLRTIAESATFGAR